MKKNISTLEERNVVLIKKNNFLKQESSRMANAMNQMKAEFDDQEQYIRRDCLEIRWIPMSAKLLLKKIIKNVGSIVDVSIDDNDISISHRRKSENCAVPPIIIKFTPSSFMCQGCSYKARSRLKNLLIEDIGLGSQGRNKIFIQESLTPARRELFHKKKCKLRNIWSFYGFVSGRPRTNPASGLEPVSRKSR